jgi:hypothetical protein
MLDSRYLRRGRSRNRSEGWPHSRSSRRPRFGRLSEVRELRREIELDAPPERVWAVVTDFDAYPEWNPFIRQISGELQYVRRVSAVCG